MNYTVTIKKLLQEQVNIFDFDYLFYKEELKKQFEEKFCDYFYTEEIGFETVALFKRKLRSELNRIHPYYEHLWLTKEIEYDILENYNLTETSTRETTNKSDSVIESDNNITNDGESTDYDTPRNNLNSPSYKNSNSNKTNSKTKNINNANSNGKEVFTTNRKGNIGVQTSQDNIMKEREVIINIDNLILEELKDLFMGVYDI